MNRHHRARAAAPPGEGAVTLTLDSLAHGGEAVGRLDGMPVFVAGGVPGDVVRVELQKKDRFARGRLLEILTPAPGRLTPDCRIHPACGGCPWMEVPAAVALEQKGRILLDGLIHVGRLNLDGVDVRAPLAAPLATRYRHRARLHAERQGHSRVLGFLPARGRGVIPVETCPVLEEPLERALKIVARSLERAPEGALDVTLSGEPIEKGGRVGVAIETAGPPDEHRWRRVAMGLHSEHRLAVEVFRKGRTLAYAGENWLRHGVAPGAPGGPYTHDASCFTQGNRAQNLNLIALVKAALGPSPGHVLELHCGCGNFTLALAPLCKTITAVESHPRAVEHLGRNIQSSGMGAKIRGMAGDADRLGDVRRALAGQKIDALVLDPPRTGAPGLAAVVEQTRPGKIIYVSCNPATLARDVAHLTALGYVLKSVQAVDLFPRTWHVEAVVVLEAA